MTAGRHIVIIGAGQAAVQAIVSLRAEGHEGSITLVGAERHLPYQRPPLSKGYLLGEMSADRLLLRPATFYEQSGVSLHIGVAALAVDCGAGEVHLTRGSTLRYDGLLLATGSRPRPLPVPGSDLAGVFTIRGMADVDTIKARLGPGTRLVVVGGGYIGLEGAASARKLGASVEVVEAADRLLARVAGPEISAFMLEAHRAHGVTVHLCAAVVELEGDGGYVRAVRLSDGRSLEADTVLVGIGALPNTDLAEAAGLSVSNGIVVDAHARTSDPAIYAAGDCTRHPNPLYGRTLRLESVQNAIDQAKSAAASLCGKDKVYAQVPWFWSDQFDLKLQMAGLIDGGHRREVRGEMGKTPFYVDHWYEDGLIAVEAINDPSNFMRGKASLLAARQAAHRRSLR